MVARWVRVLLFVCARAYVRVDGGLKIQDTVMIVVLLCPSGQVNAGCSVIYDVFICYSSKDSHWARELLEELERRGFRCCVDFRDFLPGAAIVENIADAIYGSRKTIAVLSPDFIQSNWCKHELRQALTRIDFHDVVPVVYRKCDVPIVLKDRTYIDWENDHVKPYFWDSLEKALKT